MSDTVRVSLLASASFTPLTVTVCVSLQSEAVKVRSVGKTIAAPVSSELTDTLTSAAGSEDSLTVKVPELASSMSSEVGFTISSANTESLSVIVTVTSH